MADRIPSDLNPRLPMSPSTSKKSSSKAKSDFKGIVPEKIVGRISEPFEQKPEQLKKRNFKLQQ